MRDDRPLPCALSYVGENFGSLIRPDNAAVSPRRGDGKRRFSGQITKDSSPKENLNPHKRCCYPKHVCQRLPRHASEKHVWHGARHFALEIDGAPDERRRACANHP